MGGNDLGIERCAYVDGNDFCWKRNVQRELQILQV